LSSLPGAPEGGTGLCGVPRGEDQQAPRFRLACAIGGVDQGIVRKR
jgi:hypothetical protein